MTEQPRQEAAIVPSLVDVSTCPFCGSDDLRPAFAGVRDHLRVSQESWTYVRCPRCRSLVLSPRPKAEDLASLYPATYTAPTGIPRATGVLPAALAAAEAVFFALQYRDQLRRVADLASTVRSRIPALMDVGCGNGRRLMQFRRLGMEVAGADFRPEPADDVRAAGIPVYECDIQRLDDVVDAESVDVITAFYVIEHADDPGQMLRSCRNVLRPDGWIAVAVPLAASCQEAVFGDRWSQVVEAPRHTAIPSREGMTRLLRATGFDDVEAVPESVALRAGLIALSLVPDGTASMLADDPTARRFAQRALAGAALVPGIAGALVETHLPQGSGAAVFLARKRPE